MDVDDPHDDWSSAIMIEWVPVMDHRTRPHHRALSGFVFTDEFLFEERAIVRHRFRCQLIDRDPDATRKLYTQDPWPHDQTTCKHEWGSNTLHCIKCGIER